MQVGKHEIPGETNGLQLGCTGLQVEGVRGRKVLSDWKDKLEGMFKTSLTESAAKSKDAF